MKHDPLIIANSFSFPEAGNVKIRVFLIEVFYLNIWQAAVRFYKLNICMGVFEMGMCKNNKRFFQWVDVCIKLGKKSKSILSINRNYSYF